MNKPTFESFSTYEAKQPELDTQDAVHEDLSPSLLLIETAISKLEVDAGAIFETDVIQAFLTLTLPQTARVMAEIKATRRVKMGDLEKAVNGMRKRASGGDGDDKDSSIAAQIVDFVLEMAELFIDGDNEAYARIDTGGRAETWRLESSGFREWVAAELYRAAGVLPKTDPIKDACNTLAGLAKFGQAEGEKPTQREVYLRAGMTEAGAYAVDLCNPEWQSVIIEPGKWHLDTAQTVPFRRAATNQELPVPLAPGAGNVDALWTLVNIKKEDKNLLLAWMLECFRADTAYPVCEIGAEQGSGKSSAQAVIRKLVDPNAANLRGKPKSPEDIYVSANHSLMVSYENLSHLTDEMQDAFCVLATGGGQAGRKLHTNFEESVMTAKRPIIMNGISVLATRQDLVDRLLNLELLPLKATERKTDRELAAMFEASRAEIFTGLLDLFAKALEILPTMQIAELPRMADFALFGAAVYAARGVDEPEAAFMADYTKMRADTIYRTLDSSPIAGAIMAYLDLHPAGTEFLSAKEAMDAMSGFKTEGESWPRSPKGFSEALKRLAPAFRQIGIRAETAKMRGNQGYPVIVKPIKAKAEPCSVSPISGNVAGML